MQHTHFKFSPAATDPLTVNGIKKSLGAKLEMLYFVFLVCFLTAILWTQSGFSYIKDKCKEHQNSRIH